ncbi:hypothetical protein C8R44DRAFT_733906 [Mycena epipterygia]|nr:hypothetical protein C8R44DRAFT_733906 [Mycena epipterygia]
MHLRTPIKSQCEARWNTWDLPKALLVIVHTDFLLPDPSGLEEPRRRCIFHSTKIEIFIDPTDTELNGLPAHKIIIFHYERHAGAHAIGSYVTASGRIISRNCRWLEGEEIKKRASDLLSRRARRIQNRVNGGRAWPKDNELEQTRVIWVLQPKKILTGLKFRCRFHHAISVGGGKRS